MKIGKLNKHDITKEDTLLLFEDIKIFDCNKYNKHYLIDKIKDFFLENNVIK